MARAFCPILDPSFINCIWATSFTLTRTLSVHHIHRLPWHSLHRGVRFSNSVYDCDRAPCVMMSYLNCAMRERWFAPAPVCPGRSSYLLSVASPSRCSCEFVSSLCFPSCLSPPGTMCVPTHLLRVRSVSLFLSSIGVNRKQANRQHLFLKTKLAIKACGIQDRRCKTGRERASTISLAFLADKAWCVKWPPTLSVRVARTMNSKMPTRYKQPLPVGVC